MTPLPGRAYGQRLSQRALPVRAVGAPAAWSVRARTVRVMAAVEASAGTCMPSLTASGACAVGTCARVHVCLVNSASESEVDAPLSESYCESSCEPLRLAAGPPASVLHLEVELGPTAQGVMAPGSPAIGKSEGNALIGVGAGWIVAVCAFLSLTAGGSYSYLTNVLFDTQCPDSCSPDTSFKKPWLVTCSILMVQGVGSLIVAGLTECYERAGSKSSTSSRSQDAKGLQDQEAAVQSVPRPTRVQRAYEVSVFDPRVRVPILIISVLDVATVGLQAVASLFLPAAINSAMRGTLLLVTAVMGRLLGVFDGGAGRVEWSGIGVSTLGSLGVGAVHVASAFFPTLAAPISGPGAGTAKNASGGGLSSRTPADAAAGLLLSLASNFTLGLSITYESRLAEKLRPRVVPLNATRCLVGSLIVLCVLFIADANPGREHGAGENGSHTLCCLSASPTLLAYTIGVGAFAFVSGTAALTLSKVAGSNFRALIYVGRAIIVWLLELAVFYGGSAAGNPSAPLYGRGWSLFSYPQAAAFMLVVAGGALTWRGRNIRAAAAAAAAELAQQQQSPSAGGDDQDERERLIGAGTPAAPEPTGQGPRGAGSMPVSSSMSASSESRASLQQSHDLASGSDGLASTGVTVQTGASTLDAAATSVSNSGSTSGAAANPRRPTPRRQLSA